MSQEVLEDGGREFVRFVQMYRDISDWQNGHLVRSISAGGYLDQPAITSHIIRTVQEVYVDFLIEKRPNTG